MAIKYRKCPDCGGKMVVRKSGKGNKFWGCTMWKENDCRGGADYNGMGARAGLTLDIREIENGYVITTSSPYASVEEDAIERHVKDREDLAETLKTMLPEYVTNLCSQIQNTTEFVDEIDEVKHEKRVKAAKRGTDNIGELLKKMQKAKAVADQESDQES